APSSCQARSAEAPVLPPAAQGALRQSGGKSPARLVPDLRRSCVSAKLAASRNGPVKPAVRIRKRDGFQNSSESVVLTRKVTPTSGFSSQAAHGGTVSVGKEIGWLTLTRPVTKSQVVNEVAEVMQSCTTAHCSPAR